MTMADYGFPIWRKRQRNNLRAVKMARRFDLPRRFVNQSFIDEISLIFRYRRTKRISDKIFSLTFSLTMVLTVSQW